MNKTRRYKAKRNQRIRRLYKRLDTLWFKAEDGWRQRFGPRRDLRARLERLEGRS